MEKLNIKQEKIDKVIEYFFLGLLVVQFVLLCYFNLSDVRYSMDHDMANGFYHCREMIRNRTINISDWHHTTSMELDTTFLFAIPIYYFIKDLFLASGISSIIYIVLYIVTVYGILKCANVDRKFIYFTITLVLTPYTFGMLDYVNMLFFGVSWYVVKALVPLMLIWLIQLYGKWNHMTKKQRILTGVVTLVYCLMLFITSLSTGIYAMMCGVIPLIVYMLFEIWIDGSFSKKYNRMHFFLVMLSLVVFFIGYKIYGNVYGEASRADMYLTKLENFAVNFRACIAGIFQLFGGMPMDDISVMSIQGILYCLRIGFVLLLLVFWGINLPKLIKKNEQIDCSKFITFLFLFNFAVVVLSDTRYSNNTTMEYRYYLIGSVPLIVLLGIQLSKCYENWNVLQRNIIYLVGFGCLAFLLYGNNANVIENWDRSSYAVELCEYFNTLDIESVFFVNDDKTSNVCRALDENHKYGTFMTDTQTLKLSYCSYNASESGSYYGAKNAIAIVKDTAMTDYMPEQIAQQYQKVGTIRWFDIYTSDMVYFP